MRVRKRKKGAHLKYKNDKCKLSPGKERHHLIGASLYFLTFPCFLVITTQERGEENNSCRTMHSYQLKAGEVCAGGTGDLNKHTIGYQMQL